MAFCRVCVWSVNLHIKHYKNFLTCKTCSTLKRADKDFVCTRQSLLVLEEHNWGWQLHSLLLKDTSQSARQESQVSLLAFLHAQQSKNRHLHLVSQATITQASQHKQDPSLPGNACWSPLTWLQLTTLVYTFGIWETKLSKMHPMRTRMFSDCSVQLWGSRKAHFSEQTTNTGEDNHCCQRINRLQQLKLCEG